MKKIEKERQLFAIGIFIMLIFVVGATYAYFSIGVDNKVTDSVISGETNKYGTTSFTTNTSKLYLKFTNDEMSSQHQGTIYYANSDSSGTPLTINPNYILATASLAEGERKLDCTYSFKITATLKKTINDNSSDDVKVTIGSTTKTLKEIVAAGTSGIIVTGKILNLTAGIDQSIALSSTVENTVENQNDLSENSYTITISPYTSGNNKGFSCDLASEVLADDGTIASKLVNSGELWNSGLDGDGYRYVGTSSNTPNNFICFGTSNSAQCTSLPAKYMYRILGVFNDANGKKYLKLVKQYYLATTTNNPTTIDYKYNADTSVNTSWENTDLYKGLNDTYFLNNTYYTYLQDNIWLNRIADWKWTAVHTKTSDGSDGPNYYSMSPSQIYLHEKNRANKTTEIGEWTTPTAKVGIMDASDFALSLGDTSLKLTKGIRNSSSILKTSYLTTSSSAYEWIMPRYGGKFVNDNLVYYSWILFQSSSDAYISDWVVNGEHYVRPVMYINGDINYIKGDGKFETPYVIGEE